MCDGYLSFRQSKSWKVSTELYPLSTKSPMKIYLLFGISPPLLKSSRRSWNCPWMSPQMITGDLTGYTLLSSIKISLIFSHRILSSLSGRIVPSFTVSSQLSMSCPLILFFKLIINNTILIYLYI